MKKTVTRGAREPFIRAPTWVSLAIDQSRDHIYIAFKTYIVYTVGKFWAYTESRRLLPGLRFNET